MIWAAIATGICLSNGIGHLALGIRRPRRATNLLFAASMAVICPFQLVAGAFNSATSLDAAIPLARYGVALAIVFMVVFAAFVREYARVPLCAEIRDGFGNGAVYGFGLARCELGADPLGDGHRKLGMAAFVLGDMLGGAPHLRVGGHRRLEEPHDRAVSLANASLDGILPRDLE
jgi:hypothetical protein